MPSVGVGGWGEFLELSFYRHTSQDLAIERWRWHNLSSSNNSNDTKFKFLTTIFKTLLQLLFKYLYEQCCQIWTKVTDDTPRNEQLPTNELTCNRSKTSFTFMWPCVVTNFFIVKPTRCTNFTNLFWHETLHVSESLSVHHQEFIHCTLSNGVCHTGL
jgi:hypothetical protein